jgi:hypothetical protein
MGQFILFLKVGKQMIYSYTVLRIGKTGNVVKEMLVFFHFLIVYNNLFDVSSMLV